MQVFTIVLAFALLMTAFSTFASGLSELFMRLTGYRVRNLQRAIRKFSAHEVWPKYKEALRVAPGAPAPIGYEVNDLVWDLTRNPVTLNDDVPVGEGAKQKDTLLNKLWGGWTQNRVDALSTEAFVQRLSQTPVGKAFHAEDETTRAQRISALSLTYERYMAASAEYFRKKAHYTTFCAAIVLAVVGNIHFAKVIAYLGQNPATLDTLIENEDEIVKASIEMQAKLEALSEEALNADVEAAVKEVTAELEQIKSDFASVKADYGLPIGWGEYPYAGLFAKTTDDPDRADAAQSAAQGSDAPVRGKGGLEWLTAPLGWMINVLFAGVLIGLGGPFWYRIYQNIGQIGSVARSLGGLGPETVGKTEISNHETNVSGKTENSVKLFEVAKG